MRSSHELQEIVLIFSPYLPSRARETLTYFVHMMMAFPLLLLLIEVMNHFVYALGTLDIIDSHRPISFPQ